MNSFLGEIKVKIAAKDYILRPTFEAIMELESHAGLSVSELVTKFTKNQVGAKDIACIIYYGGIMGAPEKNAGKNGELPEFNEIGSQMMRDGFTSFLSVAMKILLAAYSGKQIEDQPEEQKKKRAGGQEGISDTPKPTPWRDYYIGWVNRMKLRPADFWKATPIEFWILWNDLFGERETDAPMTSSELKELMEKFPDGEHA